MKPNSCPSNETLNSYCIGLFSEADARWMEEHLESCPGCVGRLQNTPADDSLVEAFRQQGRKPRPRNPLLDQLCERGRSLFSSRASVEMATTDSRDRDHTGYSVGGSASPAPGGGELDFLKPPQPGGTEIGWLGNYRLLRELGRGGMGMVFEAEDSLLKRKVALKLIRPTLAGDVQAQQRFLREARAVAALQHDNIVTIYQVGEEQGTSYFAMQMLQGESLLSRLQREPLLPVAEAVRIARETALGLAVAHSQGIIHRDIKPGNLFLEEVGGRVKIMDFGLAWMDVPEAEATQTGAVLGTPGYMAPEQTEGEVDHRADLFSLGCVLYRMVTGTTPFKGDTALQRMRSLLQDIPVPARQLNSQVSEPLSRFIERLMARDRKDRPVSAAVVAKVLETTADQLPPSASYPVAIPLQQAPKPVPLPDATETLQRPARGKVLAGWRRSSVLGTAAALLLTVGVLSAAMLLRSGLGGGSGGSTLAEAQGDGHDRWKKLKERASRRESLQPLPGKPQNRDSWILRPTPLAGLKNWTIFSLAADNITHSRLTRRDEQLDIQTITAVRYLWDFKAGPIAVRSYGANYRDLTPGGTTALVGILALQLWDEGKPRQRTTLCQEPNGLLSGSISPDGSLVAVILSNRVQFYDVEKGRLVQELETHNGYYTYPLAWHPEKQLLAYIPRPADRIVLASPASETPVGSLAVASAGLDPKYLSWHPDGKFVTVVASGKVVLINQESGTNEVLEGTESLSSATLSWSLDGRRLAYANDRNDLVMYDLSERKIAYRLHAHPTIAATVFLADGLTLASSGSDRLVRFWSIANGEPRGTLALVNNRLIGFSADGHHTASQQEEQQLIYQVEYEDGRREDLTPAEFADKFGWKNDPSKVKLIVPE